MKQGLDLQGGVRVLLEPDPDQHYSSETLNREISATRDQIEQHVNGGLGVNEPSIRIQSSNGQPRIAVELPGYTGGNQQEAINTLLKTGTLEFWNTGLPPKVSWLSAQHSSRNNTLPTIQTANRPLQGATWMPDKSGSASMSKQATRKSTSP